MKTYRPRSSALCGLARGGVAILYPLISIAILSFQRGMGVAILSFQRERDEAAILSSQRGIRRRRYPRRYVSISIHASSLYSRILHEHSAVPWHHSALCYS